MIITNFAVVALLGAKMPRLMEVAKPIATIGNWVESLDSTPDYQWVDSRTIIMAAKLPQEPPRLHFFDVKTGTKRDVDCAQEFGGFGGDFTTLRVSPDGKKILWGGDKNWFVATFGQNRIPSFPRKKNRQVASSGSPEDFSTLSWSQDSRSVLECALSFKEEVMTSVWIRPINQIEKEKAFSVMKGYVDWPATIIGENIALSVTGTAMGPPKPSIGFVTWSPSNPMRTKKQWTIQVPKGRRVDLFVHSRDGKRILWDLTIANPKSQDPWDPAGEELWVSDAQGKRWVPVASVPKRSGEAASGFGMPKWIPGDEAVSFPYQGKLYRLSVPR